MKRIDYGKLTAVEEYCAKQGFLVAGCTIVQEGDEMPKVCMVMYQEDTAEPAKS